MTCRVVWGVGWKSVDVCEFHNASDHVFVLDEGSVLAKRSFVRLYLSNVPSISSPSVKSTGIA